MKKYLWAFPGTGKSSLDIPRLTVVDADSNYFAFKNVAPEGLHGHKEGKFYKRDESYPENYLRYIQAVEADVVLLNCHINLLSELDREILSFKEDLLWVVLVGVQAIRRRAFRAVCPLGICPERCIC